MRYSALAPGKRLRPGLCLAASEAVGGTDEDALDAACALEMVHCFSLIHDDLPSIDDDDLRRGRPTCHKVYGEAIAILAGDALFALAFQIAASTYEPSKSARCAALLAAASGTPGLVAGEVLDVLSEGTEPTLELVQQIHAWKTGSLIAASCEIGAILGGASEKDIQAIRDFGTNVGLAFQIADDILNETSTEEQLGKAVGSDRARMKQTYPAVMGLESARTAAETAVNNALNSLQGLSGDTSALADLARYSMDRSV